MTDRLYYHDSYLTEFRARVVDASPDRQRVYLDRTAFYPTSGGQPFDTGELGGVKVLEVADEGDRIVHVLGGALAEGAEVAGRIDRDRRFDHMQQHTGQHLLSAVLIELFDAPTVSFHLGADACTIDVARGLTPEQLREAERRANQIVFENRPVTVSFQDSAEDLALRKPTEREGTVRIISIDNLDRSACGGTHVRATGEIGPILIRKLDRIRGNLRIEFLCGGRAVARARADFEALSEIARVFSSPLDDAPGLVAAQREKLQESERVRQKLATELAQASGRALYAEAVAGPDGMRRAIRRGGVVERGITRRGASVHGVRPGDFRGAGGNASRSSAGGIEGQRRQLRRGAEAAVGRQRRTGRRKRGLGAGEFAGGGCTRRIGGIAARRN